MKDEYREALIKKAIQEIEADMSYGNYNGGTTRDEAIRDLDRLTIAELEAMTSDC